MGTKILDDLHLVSSQTMREKSTIPHPFPFFIIEIDPGQIHFRSNPPLIPLMVTFLIQRLEKYRQQKSR